LVSEVKDWIVPDFVLCMMEREGRLQEMMERLFVNHEKMEAKMMAGEAELKEEVKTKQGVMKANQEIKADVDVKVEVRLKQLNEDIKGDMEALEGLKSYGKRMTACQVSSVVCPGTSKVGPEEIEADVVTFEECYSKMEATNLEVNPDATATVMERQKPCERLVGRVSDGQRSGPRTVLGPNRSCLPPRND
jgi:hypothetical protein